MAFGNKNNENNPFYPPKKESTAKEIGTTAAVVIVCLLLVGLIVKFFNYYAIEERKAGKGQDVSYEADAEYSDYEDSYEESYPEDYVQEEIVQDETVQDESMTEDMVEPAAALLPGNPEESVLNYTYIPISSAHATSTISQSDVVNTPIVVFDGLDETSWQEGVEGYGIGEGLVGYFSDPFAVKYIGFKLGNWKSDKYYFGNAKPKTLTIKLGEFEEQITFTGERRVEWVKIDGNVVTDSIQVTINDIYPGTDWEDTCIAEISVYGE